MEEQMQIRRPRHPLKWVKPRKGKNHKHGPNKNRSRQCEDANLRIPLTWPAISSTRQSITSQPDQPRDADGFCILKRKKSVNNG